MKSITDDMRLPHIVIKPYPLMSVEDFNEYISRLGEYFFDADHEFIMTQMINNDVSSDIELQKHFDDNGISPEFTKELLAIRPYFWDFRYSQHISI